MADKETIEVRDPTIEAAEPESGDTPDGDEYPNGDYASIDVERNGDSFAIAVGDTLVTPEQEHGEIDRIVRHPDNGISDGQRWNWTVYFDYTEESGGSYGGCALGELAKQLSNNAELV